MNEVRSEVNDVADEDATNVRVKSLLRRDIERFDSPDDDL